MEVNPTFDNILLRIVRVGLLACLFVPLIIFRNSFSIFNFGKVVVFRTLIEILLVAYIPLLLKHPFLRPRVRAQILNFKSIYHGVKNLFARPQFNVERFTLQDPIFFGLILFTLSMAVSTFTGVNWFKSFWGEWERMGGLFSWLHYVALFIMLVSVFRTREEWRGILWTSVMVAVISTAYGFLQKGNLIDIVGATQDRLRIFGTLGNPAAFAGYLLFNFYFAAHLFFTSVNRTVKSILLFIGVLFLIALAMTVVRGAILAMLVSVLFWALLAAWHRKRALIIAVLAIAAFGLASLWQSGIVQRSDMFSRLTQFNDATVQSRFIIWNIAGRAIGERPLFGWGGENFESAFSVHYDPAIFSGAGTNVFDRAHNIVLDTAVNQGIIGVLAWIFLWGIVVFSIAKPSVKPPREGQPFSTPHGRYAFYALIVGYMVHSLFFFDLSSQFILLMVVFAFISAPVDVRHDNVNAPELLSSKLKTPFVIPLVSGLSALVLFYTAYSANIRPAYANYYATRGLIEFYRAPQPGAPEGDTATPEDQPFYQAYQRGIEYFTKALDYSGWSRGDVARKFSEAYTGASAALEGRVSAEDLSHDTGVLLDELTRDRHRRELEFSSYIYEYKTERLLALYSDPALFRDIKVKQSEAIARFPNVVELYYDIAESYFYLQEYDQLVDALEKAHALNTAVPDSQFKLGKAYLLFTPERYDEGMSLVKSALAHGETAQEEIQWLGGFLIERKDYKNLVAVFQLLAEKDKSYLVQLSYSYLISGNIKSAREIAQEAFRLPLSDAQNSLLIDIMRVLDTY